MYKFKTLALLALGFMPNLLFSQNKIPTIKDLIQVETSMNNPKFYVNGEKVRLKTAQKYIADNPEALKYFKKGKTNLTLDYIFGSLGGYAFGWEIGSYIFNRAKFNPIILGGSIGFIGIELFVHSSSNKAFKKAIDIYRDDKIGQTETIKYPCKLGINKDGSLAVVVSF